MDAETPRVVAKYLLGELLAVKIDRYGERIPPIIYGYDREKDTMLIVFQIVGASSYRMAELNEDDFFEDVVGPLGYPSELTKKTPEELRKMNIFFVAGSVDIAPIHLQIKWSKEQGVAVDVMQGARNKDLMILEDEMRAVCRDHPYVATDDGSCGFHGLVTVEVEELAEKEDKHYDLCIATGPMTMMKFVILPTKKLGTPTVASMNSTMVDDTGVYGVCRLVAGNGVKFACVDGSESSAHETDFDQVMKHARVCAGEEGRECLREREGKMYHGGYGNCGRQQ